MHIYICVCVYIFTYSCLHTTCLRPCRRMSGASIGGAFAGGPGSTYPSFRSPPPLLLFCFFCASGTSRSLMSQCCSSPRQGDRVKVAPVAATCARFFMPTCNMYMFVCMYVCMFVLCMYVCTYSCMCVYVGVHVYVCLPILVDTKTHTHSHSHISIHTRACTQTMIPRLQQRTGIARRTGPSSLVPCVFTGLLSSSEN